MHHQYITDAVHEHGVYDASAILVYFARNDALCERIEELGIIRLKGKREQGPVRMGDGKQKGGYDCLQRNTPYCFNVFPKNPRQDCNGQRPIQKLFRRPRQEKLKAKRPYDIPGVQGIGVSRQRVVEFQKRIDGKRNARHHNRVDSGKFRPFFPVPKAKAEIGL